MAMDRKLRVRRLVVMNFCLLMLLWWVANPGGGFGHSGYGLTTFSRIPIPVRDIQVRADGSLKFVSKTHELNLRDLDWLVGDKPEVLIIATGWDGFLRIQTDIINRPLNPQAPKLKLMKTGEALNLFNELTQAGTRVAIHVHSTC